MVQLVADVVVQVAPPGLAVTVYPVMAEPPLLAGAVHEMVAEVPEVVADAPVGASGREACGAIDEDDADDELVSTEFVAVTVKV